jgi:hypothetical protein
MPKRSLEIIGCPECAAPAEVVDRFVLESTDGPVAHAVVLCVLRHRFTMLVGLGRTDRADSHGPRPGPH